MDAPRFSLEEVAEIRRKTPAWARLAIAFERSKGTTWAAIARVLGVSIRGAQKMSEGEPDAEE